MSRRRVLSFDQADEAPYEALPLGDPLNLDNRSLLDLLNAEYPLPRYHLDRVLGHGGAARLLALRDQRAGLRLAFKFVAGHDTAALSELNCERRSLALLQHPNIPRLHDYGRLEGGITWLSMSLQAGQALAQCPSRGSLRERCARLLPIAEALRHAHEQGVYHGDVSPANILIADDGSACLLDWGSARVPEVSGYSQRMTAAYAAPERRQGDGPSRAGDIYAFGAVLRERLQDLRLSREARAFLNHCLAEEAGQRYASMAELEQDLRALVVDDVLSVCPEGPLRRLWRWSRRHPLTMVTTVLLLLSLLLVGHLVHRQWRLKQRSWETVLYADFAQQPSGDAWRSAAYPFWQQARARDLAFGSDGVWAWENGGISSRGTANWEGLVTLRSPWQVGGDVQISWQVRPLVGARNCNAWIGPDRFNGWGLHIAGYAQPNSVVLSDARQGQGLRIVAMAQLPAVLQPGQDYDICWRLVGPEISVLINGEECLRYVDPFYAGWRSPQPLGWEAAVGEWRLDNVHIERLQQSMQVSAVRLPDQLAAHGLYQEALQACGQLPVTALAAQEQAFLLHLQARCELALGRQQQALQRWQQLFVHDLAQWRGVALVQLVSLGQLPSWAAMRACPQWARLFVLDHELSAVWKELRLPSISREGLRSAMQEFHTHCLTYADHLAINYSVLQSMQLPAVIVDWARAIHDQLLGDDLRRQASALHASLGEVFNSTLSLG